jgi:hypothetical protein
VEGEGDGLNCGRSGGGRVGIYRCWVRARRGSLIAVWKRFLIAVRSDGWVCVEESTRSSCSPLDSSDWWKRRGTDHSFCRYVVRIGDVAFWTLAVVPCICRSWAGIMVYGPKRGLKSTTLLIFSDPSKKVDLQRRRKRSPSTILLTKS